MDSMPGIPQQARVLALPADRSVSALWAPWTGQDPIQMRSSFWRCSGSHQSMIRVPPGTWLSAYLQKPNVAWLGQLDPDTLQGLSLHRFPVHETRAALESVRHLTGLIQLFVAAGAGITGEDLDRLDTMARLAELRLEGAGFGDETLDRLQGIGNLVGLSLSRTAVSGSGIARLDALERLRYLSITGTPIPGETMARLGAMPSLELLDLEACRVDQDVIEAFPAGKQVRVLDQRAARTASRRRGRGPVVPRHRVN